MATEDIRILDQCDSDLDYVRAKRKQVIESLTSDGVPRDTKVVQTLLMALSDMDRTTLGKKRITADKELGANHNQAMELIASMFNDPRLKSIGKVDNNPNTNVPELSSSIPDPEVLSGEADINATQENYDIFMSRINKS